MAPHPDGDGVARVLRAALEDAGCCPGDVGHSNAHGTSTRMNEAAEAAAVVRVFGDDMPRSPPRKA
ncbi:hypothetical protein [Streptomyces flavidovirens]|uniref:Beta-ketoacyl synthase C-terminal domain-containing protein n=1 Tax=Streptomyces flavidovirens TaxID=67298 RepID=A0ABW6RQ37_9ACTN